LHPTPAVGGLPQGKAVSWILEHEQAERGWYAAPIGWLDAKGDGEFYVALRSALISGKNIHIYAGAGIVAESDPEAEYAETELKLSGMLSALGLAC
jgi:salicylate biosynthesis isochorismate synthase